MHTHTDFFICVTGHDHNPGTKELPFASLERAKETLRQRNKDRGEGPLNVWVREGIYYLESSLRLSSSDSGSQECPIIYSAYPGENPVISGGKRLQMSWKPYRNGIWYGEIPEWKGVPREALFTQLFVNGKRQVLARFPNGGANAGDSDGYCYPTGRPAVWPHREFQYDPDTFTRNHWHKPEEAVIHIFGKNKWGNLQWRIEAIDKKEHTISLGAGGYQINDIMQGEDATGIDQRSNYYIENVFEELDSPGEWYADRVEGLLYYYPPEGVDLANAIVEVPVHKQLIVFEGTQELPVKNVTFSGFRFAHTASTYLDAYEAPSLGDWTIHRGGAVFMQGAENCSVQFCHFDAVGGNALFMNNYNLHNRVYGNWISEAGESAVCLVGSKQLTLGSNHAYPAENTISNNKIHDIGVYGKQTAGIFVSVSRGNVISHNQIYRIPRAAICINDGTWGGHVIEHNDIFDTVRETGDHGPFNSWGRDRFWSLSQSHGPASHEAGNVKLDARETTIIRNNRFVDNKGWGIDLDDGSSNYLICSNLCIGVSVKLREGDYRTVENNIFYNGANPPGIHIGYEHNHDRFVRNIIVMNSKTDNPEVDIDFVKGHSKGSFYEFIGPPLAGKWVRELNHNLFYNDLGHFLATVHYRPLGSRNETYMLEEWRMLGWDLNSSYGDPLFIDPMNGDFRVSEESPAITLGFKNFDMHLFGLKEDFPKVWGD
jgi:hypothetical protein